MDIFYICSVLYVVQYFVHVDGVHTELPASNSASSYQGQRVLTRPGSRPVIPTRASYIRTQRHLPYQTVLRQQLDSRLLGRYIERYPSHAQLNHNIGRPMVRLPPNHPFIPPHANFRRVPPFFRHVNPAAPSLFIPEVQEGVQSVPVITRSNIARDFSVSATSRKVNENPFLTLLDERRPFLRDENDISMLRNHLIELNAIGARYRPADNARRLDKQVDYMENITDDNIQREVLKIFVKDMIEKSGFLDGKASTAQDIDALVNLIDRIGLVTNKFSLSKTKHMSSVRKPTQVNALKTNSEDLNVTSGQRIINSDENLRERISSASRIFDRNSQPSSITMHSAINDSRTFQRRPSDDSRSTVASKPSVGMSIFGDKSERVTNVDPTPTTNQDSIILEPLGGDNAYWTHLRAGLVDLLCSLCRQRQHVPCITRYCSNDTVRTETETPAPVVEQTSA